MYLPIMFTKDGKMDREILRDENARQKVMGSIWPVVRNECLSNAKVVLSNSMLLCYKAVRVQRNLQVKVSRI